MKQLLIGTIVNTHGLKGELKVKPKTHFIEERFSKGNTVYLKYNGEMKELQVNQFRIQKDMLLVTFETYFDINLVEAWKGSDLYVDASTLQELDNDEIYYHELYDCEVYDIENNFRGKVVEVIETGANAVLRIQHEDSTFLLPYVKAFIKEVHKKDKKIIVEIIEGVL